MQVRDLIPLIDFSYPPLDRGLENSILNTGQLCPIITSRINTNNCIIDGYKRYYILRMHNIKINSSTLPPTDIHNALNIYLEINSFHRKFNIIEKIRISKFIKSNKISIKKELISRSEIGNINLNSNLYDFVERLNEAEKDLIIDKQFSIISIERLFKISSSSDIHLILKLIRDKNFTHQQSREIISDLYILAMRGEDIQKIIKGLSEQTYEDIRQKLRKITNPVLTKMEESIKDFSGRFKNISLSPPQNFEGDRYSINAIFASENDLDRIIDDIKNLKEEWKNNPILK